ncbi:hypothetical protein PTKIN_Ptkin15bG0037400 [Pterospermum kingtungense]
MLSIGCARDLRAKSAAGGCCSCTGKLPTSEIASTINEFRSRHLAKLTELCEASGSLIQPQGQRLRRYNPRVFSSNGFAWFA